MSPEVRYIYAAVYDLNLPSQQTLSKKDILSSFTNPKSQLRSPGTRSFVPLEACLGLLVVLEGQDACFSDSFRIHRYSDEKHPLPSRETHTFFVRFRIPTNLKTVHPTNPGWVQEHFKRQSVRSICANYHPL